MKRVVWLATLVSVAVVTRTQGAPSAAALPPLPIGTVVAWGANTNGETDVPPGLTNAIAVSAGIEHSLALRADHTVVAWGADEYHQTDIPEGLSNVVAISTRGYHNLALKSDGTVAVWGLNNTFQLEVPDDVTNVVAIAAGGNHNLALRGDGTVVAWGWDAYGEIEVPPGLSNVVAIAAGSRHSLALKNDGTVVVWGYPGYDIDVPTDLNNVQAISAGRFYNLALRTDGTVAAWGDNSFGQTNVPSDWTNIVQIAAGGFHNLALRADGSATGFGLNDFGQAQIPPTVTNIVALAGGTWHSLAIMSTMTYTYDPSGAQVAVAITSPAPDSSSDGEVLAVQGTAQSPHGVYAVFYQLNDGPWQSASSLDSFTDWSAQVGLEARDNVLRAYAVDAAGFISTTNSVHFTFKPVGSGTLLLQIVGNGRVSPDWTGGKTLDIGRAYRLKATPAPGWVFYQWSGDTNSFNSTLDFIMHSNLTLVANFVPNPYAPLKGTFTGLFFGDSSESQSGAAGAGALTLNFTRNGTYSGKISQLSGTTSFSGSPHLDGNDTNVVVLPIAAGRSNGPGFTGSLQIDLTDPSQSLSGSLLVTSGKGSNALKHLANFQGFLVRTAKANPDQGLYNFNLDPDPAITNAGPIGGSFGRLSVRTGHTATVALSMADQNATATVGTSATTTGMIPFFAPLYGHKGLVMGWLQAGGGAVLSSNVLWFKPANASKTYYSQGFAQSLNGGGALFTPAKRAELIPASTGTISLNDGATINSMTAFTVANGVCSVPSGQNPEALSFSFSPGSGLMSGNVHPAGSQRRLALKGVLISTGVGTVPFATGYFVEPSQTGSVGVGFQ